MKRLKTLRVRFALWIAGLFLTVLVVFGLLVYFGMAQGLGASIDSSLILNASQIGGAVDAENGELSLPESFAEEPENADLREQGFTMRVLNLNGQPVEQFGPYRGLPIVSESIVAAQEHETTFDTLTDPFFNVPVRVYTAPIEDDDKIVGFIQVAQSLARVQDTLRRLLTTLLVSVPLLVIVAGLSGYFLAARALAPIDQITRTAHSISVNDLSARLNLPATDDEVGRLAVTFDTMLARLQKAFQHERQFTADAAHELRTPLSAMQAILGMIREKRRAPEEYEQALADLAEEADRLRTLTEDLFLLSRSDMAGRRDRAKGRR
jgi:signal transduction histidine kinase